MQKLGITFSKALLANTLLFFLPPSLGVPPVESFQLSLRAENGSELAVEKWRVSLSPRGAPFAASALRRVRVGTACELSPRRSAPPACSSASRGARALCAQIEGLFRSRRACRRYLALLAPWLSLPTGCRADRLGCRLRGNAAFSRGALRQHLQVPFGKATWFPAEI